MFGDYSRQSARDSDKLTVMTVAMTEYISQVLTKSAASSDCLLAGKALNSLSNEYQEYLK